jgi:hypothetical protein
MAAAPAEHPSAIMNVHAVAAAGQRQGSAATRVSDAPIVGNVILKGKRAKWGKPKTHYHDGMPPGENTLNSHCARLLIRDVLSRNDGAYNRDLFLQRYVEFMTADPPQHPDTYAEAYHRVFFDNLVNARTPPESSGGVSHDTPSIGAFVTVAPLALSELLRDSNVERVRLLVREHLALTHPDATLASVADEYVLLLSRLLDSDDGDADECEDILLRSACKWVRPPFAKFKARATLFNDRAQLSRSLPSGSEPRDAVVVSEGPTDAEVDDLRVYVRQTAVEHFVGRAVTGTCFIQDAWPSVLFMACKFNSGDPATALLANTNVGGENCHRGVVLGSLLGLTPAAQAHDDSVDALCRQLRNYDAIAAEIDQWLSSFSRHSGG